MRFTKKEKRKKKCSVKRNSFKKLNMKVEDDENIELDLILMDGDEKKNEKFHLPATGSTNSSGWSVRP